MLWLWILLGVIGFIVILFFVTLFFIYHGSFYTPIKGQNEDMVFTGVTEQYGNIKEIKTMVQACLDMPFEPTSITSFDHKKLVARVYRNPKSDTVCIMCHGYRGTPCRDFSGGGVDMVNNGFNVILISERGHYGSEGHSITFGVREKEDVKSWIDYARKEFGEDKRIVLVGISMGAASVLMASDYLKEGDKVIADCPFTTPREVICSTIKNFLHMNPTLLWPVANLSSIIYGHTNLAKEDANVHVKKSKAKILIIHGEEDKLIPYQFSKRIANENPDKVRYELFPKAEHGISYIIDKERYQRVVNEFLNE